MLMQTSQPVTSTKLDSEQTTWALSPTTEKGRFGAFAIAPDWEQIPDEHVEFFCTLLEVASRSAALHSPGQP